VVAATQAGPPLGVVDVPHPDVPPRTGRTARLLAHPVVWRVWPTGNQVRMLLFIISVIIFGLIAGFIARALVPGDDSMGLGATMVLGIVGSFIGGFLGYVLFGADFEEGALQPSGLIGAVIGAIIALLVYRSTAGRGRASRI
jgi:uncharacterized membrane protein YeaQ/YmgE (transglycosylase-associated protein family)